MLASLAKKEHPDSVVHDSKEQKLFPTLPPDVLDKLKEVGTVLKLHGGEQILYEGDVDYPFFAVLDGRIGVRRLVQGNNKRSQCTDLGGSWGRCRC